MYEHNSINSWISSKIDVNWNESNLVSILAVYWAMLSLSNL